jgi:hypothetical protein
MIMTCTRRGQAKATGAPGPERRGLAGWARLGIAAGLLVALAATFPVHASTAAPGATSAQAQAKVAPAPPSRKKSPYKPESLTRSARDYYSITLGVDDLKVHRTNAGNLIRFSYRVTNPAKAVALTDRQATPYLIGHSSHAVLQVPVMDKVGPLRQATRPEPNKEYWMVFSNKGDVVKAGERVSVVVGRFRVDGLKVE